MEIRTAIIGAGVVGLAIAAELSKTEDDIFIIEKNISFGMETSSRNSEVIHAGIYYPRNSFKAKLCVEGNALLYERCGTHRIRHKKCGKLIVATNKSEEHQLEIIKKQAIENNVAGMELISKREIKKLEPSIQAISALFSPSSGIIDSHGFMRSLMVQAKQNGVNYIYETVVKRVEKTSNNRYKVHVIYPDGKPFSFYSQKVINCAGLESDNIAASVGIDISKAGYEIFFWKGEYFSLNTSNHSISRLIYPVPDLNNIKGLGIHVTIDLTGRLKFGPNAKFLPPKTYDFTVDKSENINFYKSLKKFLPFIKEKDLIPEMAGIRPKLQKPNDLFRDFIIKEETKKGLPGFVNLVGIESPGLTSSLAIAKFVKNLFKE